MQLPVLLLLLAAVGRGISKSTSEKSPASSQTSKRELLEGNFGQRTVFLTKYESPNTPGVQYADKQQELREQSAAQQIFGSRVFPITKISDLLTGQGPPFDIALANHLYAPVSVYNTKFQKVSAPTTQHNFNQQKPKSEEDTQYFEDVRQKKTLSRNPTFHLPGILGPEFYTRESKYPQELLRPRPFTTTPEPLFVYRPQSDFGGFIPANYYQQQSSVKIKPEDLGFDYENQDSSREGNEQGLRKVVTTYRAEQQNNPSDNIRSYNAHPGGALSYTHFINDQALLDVQPDSQNLYKVPHISQQQAFEREYAQEQRINVPGPPPSNPSDNLVPQQQYVTVFHGPYKQQPHFQGEFQHQVLTEPQFHFDQRSQQPQFYIDPIKNQFSQTRNSLGLQSLEKQHALLKPLLHTETNTESLGQSTPTKFTAQQSAQDSIPRARQYTPTPLSIKYQQLVALDTAQQIQLQNEYASKSSVIIDQDLQPTTIRPNSISSSPRNLEPEQKYLSNESNSGQTPQPTLQSLSASPETLQSLSTPQPAEHYLSSTPQTETSAQEIQASPHQQVQVQQQNFQEIHSQLAPERQDNQQQVTQYEQQSLETTPQHRSSTPQPTETSTPDYEIEIASHVDHSQLPKDLQPVTTAQETNNLEENHGQQRQQYNKTHVLVSRPYIEPIQSFGEPSYQNINYHDPNSFFLSQSLEPIQPTIQPQVFSNGPEFVFQPHFQQTPGFPQVQYFGKYARSIFGGF